MLDIREKFCTVRRVRQVVQGSCGCPILANAGWGHEQSGLMKGSLPMAEGLELDDL